MAQNGRSLDPFQSLTGWATYDRFAAKAAIHGSVGKAGAVLLPTTDRIFHILFVSTLRRVSGIANQCRFCGAFEILKRLRLHIAADMDASLFELL